MRKPDLLRQFSVYSLFVVLGVGFFVGLVLARQITLFFVEHDVQTTSRMAASIINHHLTATDFDDRVTDSEVKKLDSIAEEMSGHDIDAVKVWNREGRIVYSNNPKFLGKKFPISKTLEDALRGEVTKNITTPQGSVHADERTGRTMLLEVYVPVRLSGSPEIVGAIEVYHSLTPVGRSIYRSQMAIATTLAVGFVVIYLSLFWLVRKASRALQDSENRHRTLVESSSDCICNLDLDGNFLYMNPAGLAAHAMTSADEIVGVHCTELAEAPHYEVLQENLQQAKNGELVRFEYESDTVDGVRWMESTLAPLKNNSGKLLSMIRISRDITENKSAKREQEELNQELRKSLTKTTEVLQQTVNALASLVEIRDPYTGGHQERVAALSTAIACELELPISKLDGIYVAGLVHDIGKICIPAEILSKPAALTKMESEIIRAHPQVSYEILRPIDFGHPVAEIARQHHERLDGSGYPRGLAENEILLGAKILAVADVVEAMISHRPHRPAHSMQKAFDEILNNRGVLYAADIVDVCYQLFTEKGFEFPRVKSQNIL